MSKIAEQLKPNGSSLIRRGWPSFLSDATFPLTYATLGINLIFFSNLVWPGEPYHAGDLGLMYGISIWILACTSLGFGTIADRCSRVKLFAFISIGYGVATMLLGFVEPQKGFATYIWFFLLFIVKYFFDGAKGPIRDSFAHDVTEEHERSQYFGLREGIDQVVWTIGLLIAGLVFQYFWREYFWIMGALPIAVGCIQGLKANEPKRGATEKELKNVLKLDGIKYTYRLNRVTMKATVLSRTNIILFAEGIFTQMVIAVPLTLTFAYFESTPWNYSPLVLSLLMIIFGIPGAVTGAIAFSKVSDMQAKKDIRNRISIIFVILLIMYFAIILMFNVPLEPYSQEQGNDIIFILSRPHNLVVAASIFTIQMGMSVHGINQSPILQQLNLPEAIGVVSSGNQFLEKIGNGLGAILAGMIMDASKLDYKFTVAIIVSLGVIGAFIWLLARKSIKRDIVRVRKILEERAIEMEKKT